MALRPQPYHEWVPEALANPDQEWLIPDFLPADSLTIIAGRPKYGAKSWIAYLMAWAISSGCQLGPFAPSRQVKTLYVDLEGVAKEAAKRVDLVRRGGIAVPPLERMQLWECHNQLFLLTQPAHVDDLISLVREEGFKVVFIDTFAKAATGVDENSAKDVGKLLLAIDALKRAGCAVVLVHHLRKAFKQEGGTMLDATAGLRGSGALEGGFDHILSVTTARVDDQMRDFWIVGGKFAPWEAYDIAWQFVKDEMARLTWQKLAAVPHVDVSMKGAFGGRG